MAAAEASLDVAAIVKIIAKTSALTVDDYVDKTVGNVMFIYFTFVDKFHCYPRTLDELVDGLLYLDAKSYIIKQETK